MWTDINVVDRFSDEFNIQVAWLRESPPSTSSLGLSFTARLRDVKALLAEGSRTGEIALAESHRRPARLVALRAVVDSREHRPHARTRRARSTWPGTRCSAVRRSADRDQGGGGGASWQR